MVERDDFEDRLTEILKAASHPSRRRILTLLVREGPLKVTEIAAYFAMSLNAVSKHIKVLEGAGLVSRVREWRDHLIRVDLERLALIDRWFAALRWVWDIRLEKLDQLLTGGEAGRPSHADPVRDAIVGRMMADAAPRPQRARAGSPADPSAAPRTTNPGAERPDAAKQGEER